MASRNRRADNLARAVAILDSLKVGRGCVDCGYRGSPAALHFDHVDPATKRAELGWAADRSKLWTAARLDRYLDHVERYCVVRCANCHAERGVREQHWAIRRGRLPETRPALF